MMQRLINLFADCRPRILQALNSKPLHGVELAKTVNIGMGRLYVATHSLESQGLISSYWSHEHPIDRKGARRRFYGLTIEGRKAIKP